MIPSAQILKSKLRDEISDYLESIPGVFHQIQKGDTEYFEIFGVIPGGRGFFIKLKLRGEVLSKREETRFLRAMQTSALVFVARTVSDVYGVFSVGGLVRQ